MHNTNDITFNTDTKTRFIVTSDGAVNTGFRSSVDPSYIEKVKAAYCLRAAMSNDEDRLYILIDEAVDALISLGISQYEAKPIIYHVLLNECSDFIKERSADRHTIEW